MGRTQIISETQMYLDHYALFEEPDDELPTAIYIDPDTKLPDLSLDLVKPVGMQHFRKVGDALTLEWRWFKTLPYLIEPAGLVPPIPQEILDAFSKILFRPVSPSEIKPLIIAVGQFYLPPPAAVTGTLQGDTFTVTKDVHFRVQIKIAFLYPPLRLALDSPFVTNGQAAAGLGIPVPPGVDPNAPLAYEWGANMTLSTATSYIRPIAGRPQPFAAPFEPGMTEIRIEGEPVSALGSYKIVGWASNVVPTATVPGILQVLFGTLTPIGELAYAEEGTLLII
jgi:hypothetical protein